MYRRAAARRFHTNRSSHGLALHISGGKKYTFEGEKTLYTGNNDVIFMPEHSNYVVEAETPGIAMR